MRRLLRRYRRWVLVLGSILLILLGRWVYFLTLPMEGWLTRGLYAMHDGRYAVAEICFTRAKRKNPSSLLPRVALTALYKAQFENPGKRSKYGRLQQVPVARDYLQPKEAKRIRADYLRAESLLGEQQAWFATHFGAVSMEDIFDAGWSLYPTETTLMADGLDAVSAGDAERAWHAFQTLETRYPPAFALFADVDGRFLYYYADAAWRAGHAADTRRILALPAAKLQPWQLTDSIWRRQPLALACVNNYRLSGPDPGARAQCWGVDANGLHADVWSAEPDAGTQVLVATGRAGAHLFTIPAGVVKQLAGTLGWWQWDGRNWRARAETDRQAVAGRLLEGATAPATAEKLAAASCAWDGDREYLSLHGDLYGVQTARLFDVYKGALPVYGFAPRELALSQGGLWVHGDEGFIRLHADGATEEYLGRRCALGGVFLGDPVTRETALDVSDDWRMARDGGGRLWLISWDNRDGGGVTLHACWNGTAFRAPTSAEQRDARAGLLDSADRLWFAHELPRGFQRDAWRAASSPHMPDGAIYAVDDAGRVWVICGPLAARWNAGHWVSVANRLPGPGIPFTNLVAGGNGVVITLPGRVACLE